MRAAENTRVMLACMWIKRLHNQLGSTPLTTCSRLFYRPCKASDATACCMISRLVDCKATFALRIPGCVYDVLLY